VNPSWIRPNLTTADVERLKCPRPSCQGGLTFHGSLGAPIDGGDERPLVSGHLDCAVCGASYSVHWGCPNLVRPGSVAGPDRLLRPIYDLIAPTHDAGVNFVLPLLQFPDPTGSRDRYIERMQLGDLHANGGPVRILEVGIGAGANLPLLEEHLPADLDVELWGLDLSLGMLLQCAWRTEWWYSVPRVRLLLGDAHSLPFKDDQFDRVFHIGGINAYRDQATALREMARVAKPQTPIVVVDEGLDPKRHHALHHRIAFQSLTWFDPDPRPPVDLLPKECPGEVTRVSRFYYCLTFHKPVRL
jgi:ubiquinone/menaquinone biosynthesis C-methylase UbiE